MHYSNLAHGSAVNLARTKYAPLNLLFGMTVIVPWLEPLDPNSAEDIKMSDYLMHTRSDWNWSPLITGDYSAITRTVINSSVLPVYSAEEQTMLENSMDFLALNYYSSNYIQANNSTSLGYTVTNLRNNVPIGPVAESTWLTVYPPGIRNITNWAWKAFNLTVYLTECGVSVPNEASMPLSQIVQDDFRVSFFQGHVDNLLKAIVEDKVPIKVFVAWALLDNFEW